MGNDLFTDQPIIKTQRQLKIYYRRSRLELPVRLKKTADKSSFFIGLKR